MSTSDGQARAGFRSLRQRVGQPTASRTIGSTTVAGTSTPADHPVVMVNLQPECSNSRLLQVARGVAASLGARVIGLGAWQPTPIDWTGGDYRPSNFPESERTAAAAAITGAETQFRTVFPTPDVEWRSSLSFASPSNYIVQQGREADLVLTGAPPIAGSDAMRMVARDLVMHCGRPVIIVPNVPATCSLDRVMVAWQATPESRRAALGALPLLQRAAKVTIVEVTTNEGLSAARRHLAVVSRWLAGHGIAAETLSAAAPGDDGEQLVSLAQELDANLIVAGAYGHSRLREWAFGGVTRCLLQQRHCCTLLSH